MITKLKTISNSHVTIVISLTDDVVCLFHPRRPQIAVKTFAGFPQLKDRFDELFESFSEAIDMNTAINHFQQTFSTINL